MLDKEELKRYNRQMILPELGMAGQQKLKQAKVLMIGAGGLGCPVLQYLTAAGVGTISIIDDDVVAISNLHRQILYSVQDVGNNKALVAKAKLQQLNQQVKITAYTDRLTEQNAAEIMKDYDLVIDGSDNFPTRYLTNDTCLALNRPLIFGSIFKFEGQVSVFNYQDGPNYRDLFPNPPAEGEVPNCAEIGVIGVLPGIVGTLMANEAIKIICGIGETLSGKLLTVNALDSSIKVFKFGKPKKPSPPAKAPVNAVQSLQQISSELLHTWQATMPDELLLIDVRETYEYDEFNIGGINMPLYDLPEKYRELPPDKKLVFVCATGQRSKMAINILKPVLQADMYSLDKGIGR